MDSCTSVANTVAAKHSISYYRLDQPVIQYTHELVGAWPDQDVWVDVIKRVVMFALAIIAYPILGLIALGGRTCGKKTIVDIPSRTAEVEMVFAEGQASEALSKWEKLKKHLKRLPAGDSDVDKFVISYNRLGARIQARCETDRLREKGEFVSAKAEQDIRRRLERKPIKDNLRVNTGSPDGMPNLGNTCFANSVFQTLLLDPRSAPLISLPDAEQPKNRKQLHQAIKTFQTEAQKENYSSKREAVRQFLNTVSQLDFNAFQKFNQRRQESGRAFMQAITSCLDTTDRPDLSLERCELKLKPPPVDREPKPEWEDTSVDKPLVCASARTNTIEISNPSTASLAEQLASTHQALNFPPENANARRFFETCNEVFFHCGEPPPVLTINIKRDFQSENGHFGARHVNIPGISDTIEFPIYNKMGTDDQLAFKLTKMQKYRPYAMLCHSGTNHSGHWWAYRSDPENPGQYKKYNDSTVSTPSTSTLTLDLEKYCTTILYQPIDE